MISIIICSRNNEIPKSLEENISTTIGCEYELLIIDNTENRYSIFEAYNIGIQKSKGEFLCFCHDDILFHTKNWGQITDKIFRSDNKVGLLGVAGSKIKTKAPSGWNTVNTKLRYVNIIQHKGTLKVLDKSGFNTNSIEKVVVIDGVFMVMRKSTRIFFNTNYNGFHCYDLTLSLDHFIKGYDVVVTNKINIEHFSTGFFNNAWLKSTIEVHKNYFKFLPLSVDSINVTKRIEILTYKRFIKRCLRNSNYKLAFLTWKKLLKYSPLVIFHIKFHILILIRYLLFRKLWL